MIELTRINGKTFLLNVLLIEQVEALPDTTVTLINGKKIVLRDPIEDVEKKINDRLKEIGLIGIHKDVKDVEGL